MEKFLENPRTVSTDSCPWKASLLRQETKGLAGFLVTPSGPESWTFVTFQLQLYLLFLLLSHSTSLFLPLHHGLGSRLHAELALGGPLSQPAGDFLLSHSAKIKQNVLILFKEALDVTDNPKIFSDCKFNP